MRAVVLLLLIAGAAVAQKCEGCHKAQASSHGSTGMAKALEPAESGRILAAHPKLTFIQGPYRYTVTREGIQSIYRVTDGKEEFTVPLGWAFGQGAAGQTYLFERNGAWYESRVSYYKDIDNLDLTVGARPDMPRSLEEAVGREMSKKGAAECFHCHSTGALPGGVLQTSALTPGVQCARCHEQAEEHAASFAKKGAPLMPPSFKKATSEDMSDHCGQCHRTWATIASNGPYNITNVRFQPYRLANSKCYDTADTRLRCTVCHDPHNEAEQPAAFYDAKCGACHAASGGKAGAKLCKVSKAGCAGCHMSKIFIPGTHNAFTDHWIRIARKGQKPPV